MRPTAVIAALVAFVGVITVLGAITRRQVAAHEELARLEDVRQRGVNAEERLAEAKREVALLLSRQRVVSEARARLDMRTPSDDELVLLRAGLGVR